MRKKIIIIIVVMLILLGCTMLIVKNNDNEKGEMLLIPVNNNELLVCSEEDSIKVYRQENQIVVYAESESAFFEGTQFSVGISGEITPENVEILWMTIGGSKEQVEDNDRIIAEVKITDNGELICDTKINFAKKAFEAVEDVLKQTTQ